MEEFQLTKKQKLKQFFRECFRVLRVTKKPSKTEFKTIVQATAIGMAIIGMIGFLIFIIKQLFL